MGQFGQILFPIKNYKACADFERTARKPSKNMQLLKESPFYVKVN